MKTKEIKDQKPTRYIYPAVFTFYGDGKEIAVDFPDLKTATSGVNEVDALLSARECLGLVMLGLEKDNEDIPAPSPLSDVQVEENETVGLVDVYMPTLRTAHLNKSVNRMVTLPAWLNAVALEHNMNFSKVLQEALMQKLNVGV